jgi:hypothetical protein
VVAIQPVSDDKGEEALIAEGKTGSNHLVEGCVSACARWRRNNVDSPLKENPTGFEIELVELRVN